LNIIGRKVGEMKIDETEVTSIFVSQFLHQILSCHEAAKGENRMVKKGAEENTTEQNTNPKTQHNR
jgi:hypothetical protein